MKLATGWLILAAAATLPAQDFHNQINWDKLAPKAVETVDVNLDANMLQMASKFIGADADSADVKKLLGQIKGIHVRSLTFGKEGEYSLSDVEAIRSQLKAPGWSKVVDVRSSAKGGDNAGVYVKTDGANILGIVVIAAEPKELTVVNIVGTLDPAHLKDLGGKFGIPNMNFGPDKKKTTGKKQDD